MTEDELREATGLVAHYYRARGANASHETLFNIQRQIMRLGVTIDHPVGTPDPTAPEGGSQIALKKVA